LNAQDELLKLQKSGQFPDEFVNKSSLLLIDKTRAKEKTYKSRTNSMDYASELVVVYYESRK
jgi:hypothetical protein